MVEAGNGPLPEDEGPVEDASAFVAAPSAPAASGGSAAEQAATLNLPHFESALQRNVASFGDVVQAHFYSVEEFNSDSIGRLVHLRYLDPLIAAFEQAEGGIVRSYYCSAIVAAAALTHEPARPMRLHVINNETNPEDVDLLSILHDCESLAVRARTHLRGDELRVCVDAIYSAVTNTLDLLDVRATKRRAGAEPDDTPLVDYVRTELDAARDLYDRSAQRNAQITYFGGMLIGTAIAAAMTAALALASMVVDVAGDARLFLASLSAGAVGGVVSVMERMTSGKLALRYETGDRFIRALGIFRPLIGAVFGVILFFLLASEILPVEIPGDRATQFYFFAAVAFLAGFSERWAQDMLVVGQGALSARAAPEEEKEKEKEKGS